MKRITSILAAAVIAVLSLSPLAAQAPVFESLRNSAGVSQFQAPLPGSPLLFNSAGRNSGELYGEALFSHLHETTVPAPRLQPSYKASKAFMYSKADNSGCGGRPGVLTFYSQVCVPGSGETGDLYRENGDANGDGTVDAFINAEHIWPQSYFNSALPMVADLHHLAPTFATPNGRRGNLKFARVAKAVYATSAGSRLGSGGFEPADAVKGNVARAMFYFIVRYSDRNIRQGMNYSEFWTANVRMLLEWNRQDPPDAAERRRNALVEEFQGNRNPFIDEPELAERIGAEVFMAH